MHKSSKFLDIKIPDYFRYFNFFNSLGFLMAFSTVAKSTVV